MISYQLRKHEDGSIRAVISSDGLQIPPDESNTNYQKYLAWVAEGNEAEQWA